ncbi:MAG: hypothetical protein ABGX10_10850 [Paracoccus sp. (in: a-proteobacteria)]|uniref:hypothetical protein n=1 Tax=Paracoccus sp. TaxID=267 RepID=UPI003242B2BA
MRRLQIKLILAFLRNALQVGAQGGLGIAAIIPLAFAEGFRADRRGVPRREVHSTQGATDETGTGEAGLYFDNPPRWQVKRLPQGEILDLPSRNNLA